MRRMVGDDTGVSFYDPKVYNQLSEETREYVPAVLAAAWLFLHPDSYNLHLPHIDGVPGQITLKRPASLSELTICLGSAQGMDDGWFRTLRNLNPRLDPQIAQPVGTALQVPKELEAAYASRCVDGPWPILANDLHSAVVPEVVTPDPPAPKRVAHSRSHYVVRRGDTLAGIVRKLGCSDVREVSSLNDLKQHRIKAGQVLELPACR